MPCPKKNISKTKNSHDIQTKRTRRAVSLQTYIKNEQKNVSEQTQRTRHAVSLQREIKTNKKFPMQYHYYIGNTLRKIYNLFTLSKLAVHLQYRYRLPGLQPYGLRGHRFLLSHLSFQLPLSLLMLHKLL